jgi:gas vesicle protein
MRQNGRDESERYIIVQERSSSGGVGPFLIGLAVGAGAALLFAPRSGAEARAEIGKRVKRAKGTVAHTFHDAREKVEERLESARAMVERRRQQVADAVEAGRTVAREARGELNHRLREAKVAAQNSAPGVPTADRVHRAADIPEGE